MSSLLEHAQRMAPQLIAIRRELHRHPEIAFEEVRTSQTAAEWCERLGLTVRRGCAKTGVIAVLNADQPGLAVALRADMDALPIHEENRVDYRSTVDGKGHLCGHDAHTTMLMGAASLLAERREQLPFPVHFFFQPAEEIPCGGAKKLIEEGHLNGIGEIFGLHVNPQLPVGVLGLREGTTMASMDRFEIHVAGVGGHGAMPHHAHDPITTAAEIILALQTVVSRRIDPLDPAVVSCCQLEAGSAFNVIPQSCRIVGTARSLSAQVREQFPKLIEDIATGVARAHGLQARCEYLHGTPVLVTHAGPTRQFAQAMRALGGKDCEIRPTMGGEDFAYYLERVPGSFAFIGAGNGSAETGSCLHHPRFNIDEGVLPWGSALLAQVVLDRVR